MSLKHLEDNFPAIHETSEPTVTNITCFRAELISKTSMVNNNSHVKIQNTILIFNKALIESFTLDCEMKHMSIQFLVMQMDEKQHECGKAKEC
ncbi:hypothetical protein TSUD_250250 [Trifolium subterraneum]|nr:hypothetical protein TSUD_250250 [Trifolium subterraneum]